LSWKEKQELDALPMKIESLEKEIAQITAQMGEPGFYTGSASVISRATEQLAKAESELERAYERWVALSGS
jgi:ATP-binding cassette subfamily F protein uup